jgi:hypothetical protein
MNIRRLGCLSRQPRKGIEHLYTCRICYSAFAKNHSPTARKKCRAVMAPYLLLTQRSSPDRIRIEEFKGALSFARELRQTIDNDIEVVFS